MQTKTFYRFNKLYILQVIYIHLVQKLDFEQLLLFV